MTISSSLIPAAQYLRMSTEHQQYSLENQSTAILKYAESLGFMVVRTYSDAAKSGLALKHRKGLRQLLQDVVSGTSEYRAILVYDISRWGRFQDTDESAHYEFVCKSAGVPVHYCAEPFANDGSITSLIMKALKRAMAGEYSRELGVKVLAGMKRLASLGFKQGGLPGYGLRRMLVSPTGVAKQELVPGERKSIAADRVILIPGPAQEVQCVKDIYWMLICEKLTVHAIARELNRRGVNYVGDSKWDDRSVHLVLTHPKYVGCHVFGRTSSRLYTPPVRMPRSEWVLAPQAFAPIIDDATFLEAQKVLQSRTIKRSDEDLLNSLRKLLSSKGRLTIDMIQTSPDMASPSTYVRRFGSLSRAYELIGHGKPAQSVWIDSRRKRSALREELLGQIAAIFPGQVSIVRRGSKWRSRLQLADGSMVSVIVARAVRTASGLVHWRINPAPSERRLVTLFARLSQDNNSFLDFYMLPNMNRRTRFYVALSDPWMSRGELLSNLSSFREVVTRVRSAKKQATA
jgi:DNA invertase Pin-like site-specific DNA recombinase